jgi:heme/copper-type cytochrome/quinol oxidase subunit 1
MRRLLLAVLLLAGCKSDRERDCAQVRDILGDGGMPRRYYDYSDKNAVIVDMQPYERLKHATWRTTEIREAATAAFDSGWTMYTPYSADATSGLDKLRALCKLSVR